LRNYRSAGTDVEIAGTHCRPTKESRMSNNPNVCPQNTQTWAAMYEWMENQAPEEAEHNSGLPMFDLDTTAGLFAFYQQKSSELRQKREHTLELSQANSKITEELGGLMGDLQQLHDKHNYGEVAKEVASFLKEHENDPNYEELKSKLQPIIGKLAAASYAAVGTDNYDQNVAAVDELKKGNFVTQDEIQKIQDETANDVANILTSSDYDGWQKSLQTISDSYSHDDQLALMQINDLTDQLGQLAKVVSALQKSGSDTINALISNMRG
jgi:hypothetical protein